MCVFSGNFPLCKNLLLYVTQYLFTLQMVFDCLSSLVLLLLFAFYVLYCSEENHLSMALFISEGNYCPNCSITSPPKQSRFLLGICRVWKYSLEWRCKNIVGKMLHLKINDIFWAAADILIFWRMSFFRCKLCHLVAKYATNTSGAIWWPNLQLMQVAPSGGQICN